MIPAFAKLFTGELAIHGERLVLSSDELPPSPGSDLAEMARLSQLLARFAEQHYPGGDRRAVASLWAKHHFAALLPPFLMLALVAKREIDVALDTVGCTFSHDGTMKRLHLRDAGRPATPSTPSPVFSH